MTYQVSYNAADRNIIKLFLVKAKMAIADQQLVWIPRSYDGFTSLGLNMETAIDIIKQLMVRNYYRGPNPDNNGDGTDV